MVTKVPIMLKPLELADANPNTIRSTAETASRRGLVKTHLVNRFMSAIGSGEESISASTNRLRLRPQRLSSSL